MCYSFEHFRGKCHNRHMDAPLSPIKITIELRNFIYSSSQRPKDFRSGIKKLQLSFQKFGHVTNDKIQNFEKYTFFLIFWGVLKEMFSNNISIEKIKKMGVFRLMARLGLSELAFVWSFYTVAQSIAFILLLSNKNVITGYIMTITRRKNSQTIF